MSKKNLLSESTIRQFMKYANIGGLTDGFINEAYGDYRREDDPMEEGHGDMHKDEKPMMEAEEEEELEVGVEEAPMDDAPPMDDAEAEIGDTSEASIETLVDALADTITQVTGVEVSAAGDEPPMDAMDDMDDMGGDEPVADVEMVDDEEIVAETMKRVTRRLRGLKKEQTRNAKRDALIENVASRIAKRLNIK